jgi:hypothetical protein
MILLWPENVQELVVTRSVNSTTAHSRDVVLVKQCQGQCCTVFDQNLAFLRD